MNICSRDVAALLLLAIALGGCLSVDLGGGDDRLLSYVLADARPDMDPRTEVIPITVIVQGLSGDPMGNSSSIAYSLAPGQRELYQLSRWTERPIIVLPRLLMQRLVTRSSFRGVALLGEGVGGELGLGIAIESIYHDAQTSPGTVQLTVRADLIERNTRELIARRNFNAAAELSIIGPAAVVEAMNLAVADIFDALVIWLESEAAAALQGKN